MDHWYNEKCNRKKETKYRRMYWELRKEYEEALEIELKREEFRGRKAFDHTNRRRENITSLGRILRKVDNNTGVNSSW
jgi:hypothetical protein